MDKFAQIAFDFFAPTEEKTREADPVQPEEAMATIPAESKPVKPAEEIIEDRVDSTPASPTISAEKSSLPIEPEIVAHPVQESETEVIDFDHISFVAEEPASSEELQVKSTRGRKSLKSFDADFPEIPEDESQFAKQYYSIGEVAQMFKVNASLLRFWETEFDIIQPRKNKKGDRHFRPVDIKNLELIYDLLRRRKLTIEGAKEYLRSNKRGKEKFEMIRKLEEIKSFLLEMKANL